MIGQEIGGSANVCVGLRVLLKEWYSIWNTGVHYKADWEEEELCLER